MVFVIKGLKYDTDKMELVSDKVRVPINMFYGTREKISDLFVSRKGRWIAIHDDVYSKYAITLTEEEAKKVLMKYDVEAYEKRFGEIEEG